MISLGLTRYCLFLADPFSRLFTTRLQVDNISLRNARAKAEANRNNGFFINQFGNAEYAEEFHESKAIIAYFILFLKKGLEIDLFPAN